MKFYTFLTSFILLLIFRPEISAQGTICDLSLSCPFPCSTVPYITYPISCADRDEWRIDVKVDSFSSSNGPITYRLTNDSIYELIARPTSGTIVDSLIEGPGDFDETNQDGIFEGLPENANYRLIVSDGVDNCKLELEYFRTTIFLNISGISDYTFVCNGSVSRPQDTIDHVFDSPPGARTFYENGLDRTFIGYCPIVSTVDDVCPDYINENVEVTIRDRLTNIDDLCCDPIELDINNNPIPRRIERSYIAEDLNNGRSVQRSIRINVDGVNCAPKVPTLSQWGLVILSLLFIIVGITVGSGLAFRNKQT